MTDFDALVLHQAHNGQHHHGSMTEPAGHIRMKNHFVSFIFRQRLDIGLYTVSHPHNGFHIFFYIIRSVIKGTDRTNNSFFFIIFRHTVFYIFNYSFRLQTVFKIG